MLTQQELNKSPLFQGIAHQEYQAMVHCFQAVRKTFQPQEVICDMAEAMDGRIGIVEQGQAAMIRIDEEGTATVLEGLLPGGVFGKGLTFAAVTEDSIQVVARTACEVLFIDHPHIFKRCENACTHHSLLVQNLLFRKIGFFAAIVTLLLFVVTTSFAVVERRHATSPTDAIVMRASVSVKSAPEKAATDMFVLHEGTKVRVGEQVEGWIEVTIADGNKGWLEERAIEMID